MAKRVAIAAIGTMGDVRPYVALALWLKAAGFDVVIGTSTDFAGFISDHGIEFWDLGSDVQAFISSASFEQMMSKRAIIHAPSLLNEGQKILKEAGRNAWGMAQTADLLVFHMNTTFCIDMAEALDIPAIMTAFQPLNPTGEFPYFAYEGPALDPLFKTAGSRTTINRRTGMTTAARKKSNGFSIDPIVNRLTYILGAAQQSYYDLPRDRLRTKLLGLKAKRRGGFLRNSRGEQLISLHAYSPTIVPRPRDWPDRAIVTGYWQLEDKTGWTPSSAFRAFLDSGPPPVYLGFGSMPWGAARNTEIITEAVKRWGGRAVIAKGWGGMRSEDLPETFFAIERAPHCELFKYVEAVVHHGGAGTTHEGLYAGLPTFVVPQFFDQPYWGKRVQQLGAGPAPVRLKKLTPAILAQALHDLSTKTSYLVAAEAIRAKMKAEHGVLRAIEVIDAALVLDSAKRHAMPDREREMVEVAAAS
jgi:UDP:flavonoid glycosyltransferase YjiC (YdhE family)